jgi:predicted RNA-binding protein YlxR (DUF448 family)
MRRKHIPLRSCIACRERFPKRDLIRIVRRPEGNLEIDPKGKLSGRGAYLCRNLGCWEVALQQRRLSQALKCSIGEEEIVQLRAFALTLVQEAVGDDRPGS